LYSCNGSGSQQWYLTGDGGELYNPQSGKCAEDPYSSTVNGRQLDIWTCNGGDNQAWTVPASPVQSGVTGKCLDDKGASSANGNVIDSYACNGQASQKWTLGLDETLEVEGKCLDATGLGTTDGTLAQLWSCNDGVNQLWYLTGTGEIENLNSEKCLANPGNSTTNDTRLELEDCTGQPGEIGTLLGPARRHERVTYARARTNRCCR
jgi:alpha-glucosidase